MTERSKAFGGGSMSNCRLTSDGSIFDGIDVESKGEAFLPDEDDALSAPVRNVAAVPVIPRVPVPHSPVAIPPGRLNSPLPHRPTSSYLDVPQDV